jgi:hypothetical protein
MTFKRPTKPSRRAAVLAAIEIAFILFLFYANLLMGEFTRSNWANKTLLYALYDVITYKNFGIGLASAILGFAFFEFLRKRL